MITARQAVKACIACQYLSNSFKNIEVFRYDPKERYIYILAGETLQILIFEDGSMEFVE